MLNGARRTCPAGKKGTTSWRGGSPKAVRIKRMHLKLQAGNQTKPSQTTTPMAHLRAANLKGRPSEPPWSHEPLRCSSLPQSPPASARVPRATCNSRNACSKYRSEVPGNPGFGSRGSRGCHGTPLQKNHKHRMPANLVELAPSSNCGHRDNLKTVGHNAKGCETFDGPPTRGTDVFRRIVREEGPPSINFHVELP